MEVYRYRKLISYIIMFPVALIILLSINFSIWGGFYEKGCLVDSVYQQMQMIQEGSSKPVIQMDQTNEVLHQMFFAFVLSATVLCLLFVFFQFVLCASSFFCIPVTLRSLSIRLND